jgi:hypothetical protein
MVFRFLFCLLVALTSSCGNTSEGRTYATYEAQLHDLVTVDQIEARMRNIAERWGLEVYEKDRNEMATLTQGKPAFYFELYLSERQPILWVTNAGAGEVIALVAISYDEDALADLDSLIMDVRQELANLDLEFAPIGSN